ncbi:branched-chain amino acid ABC transporter permease [bacterium]|nr:branched-chain amino acid ABC transporter permease [bacterium]
MKSSAGWLAALAACWVMHFFVQDYSRSYYFLIFLYAGINIVLAVSLNLVNGVTGQFSMGHAGFMSIGGYVSCYLITQLFQRSPALFEGPLSMPIFAGALVLGGIAAAIAGYLVGLPSLRLKGDYLAIVTLGFGEIIRVILLNVDAVGGARGLGGIPNLTSFGVVYTCVIVTVFCVWRIIRSAQGRALLAVREDEIAASAMGVNTTRSKVSAFVIGAFFAGIAGGLFGSWLTVLTPQTFDFNKSFEIIIMVVLGGMGSVSGSIVAAIFLTIIREALRPLQDITKLDFRMIIYSLMLIVLMLTKPRGLFGSRELVKEKELA